MKFDTVFFGGGTPSLLNYDEFSALFESLYKYYDISPKSEVTIEANPGTLDKKKLSEFKKLPINRMSFGVQSFFDSDLKFLSRIHTAEQAIGAIKSSQDAGFDNLNLDLIFALPGQTSENWISNLNKAVELGTKHISAYSLIFEEGTFLNTLLHRDKVKKADIELEQEMYEQTMDFLPQHGFNQYEISNYALEGYECRHNLKYWEYDNYISFGPSASSFHNMKRWTNVKDVDKYIERIDKGNPAAEFSEEIDKTTSITENIFLGLRSKGIDIGKFNKKYDEDFIQKYGKAVNLLLDNKFATLTNNHLKLTQKGYALCDEIVATYF
jgi:oxygen-independent coproporphyrinogen-3 oxidase